MNSMDVDVLRTAIGWLTAGRRATLGTVVHTWGSSPRPPGSLMVIRDDGQVAGSLSGGCIEDDLILRVRAGELGSDVPRATLYGATAEEARRFGLPCAVDRTVPGMLRALRWLSGSRRTLLGRMWRRRQRGAGFSCPCFGYRRI